MTKSELEKEAREYLAEHSEYNEVFGQTFVAVDTLTAMVDFAEPREKRIAELEAQIEKMRNCANCKNYNGNEGFCVLGSGYGYNCNLEKWEIKEK